MYDSDYVLLRQLDVVLEERIKMLTDEFFEEYLDSATEIVDTTKLSRNNLFTDIPDSKWTERMFNIYGEVRGLYWVNEFISSHLDGSKPLSLE